MYILNSLKITVKTCNKTILIVFQHQSKVSASLASGDLLTSSACVGADTLLKLLGNYCRNKDIKTAITVGIVGMLMSFEIYMKGRYSINVFSSVLSTKVSENTEIH